jgi:curved DNA-binding protein CbpA
MNLYEILGVSRDATPEEIKSAYRKLAMRHHPDRGGGEVEFKRIQTAYDCLSDSDRRKRYDETGQENEQQGPTKEQAAEMMVMASLMECVKDQDFEHTDIVYELKRAFGAKAKQFEAERTGLEKQIARTERAKNRLIGGKADAFEAMVDARIAGLKAHVERKKAEQEIADLCVQFLSTMSWAHKPHSPQSQIHSPMSRAARQSFEAEFRRIFDL